MMMVVVMMMMVIMMMMMVMITAPFSASAFQNTGDATCNMTLI